MADDWFDNMEPDEEVKIDKKEDLIDNKESLLREFDNIMNRVQMHTNEAYGAILPIVTDLIGHPDDPNTGSLSEIRQSLRETRFLRTTTGTKMWRTIESVEELNSWQTRYYRQLEEFLDGLRKICESSFAIIKRKDMELERKELQLRQVYGGEEVIERRVPVAAPLPSDYVKPYSPKSQENAPGDVKTQMPPEVPPPVVAEPPLRPIEDLLKEEDPKFIELVKDRIDKYNTALKSPDKMKKIFAKGSVFCLANRDKNRRKLIQHLFDIQREDRENIEAKKE